MLTNSQVSSVAGNGGFQTAAQVASIIQANIIISDALDGSPRLRKRNALAQQIINDIRSKVEAFSWAIALNSTVKAEATFDADGNPVISDATIFTAAGEVWDNIAGVVTGDEVIPTPFVPPTP